ncbi:MAG: tRNA (adenosine(37)-N6)-dimethylallyltransferase MiaA [Desulfuromonadaceae bacterium]|nr:tRNA (adenosine(37)-N6)-dimethylallyltransferase MiaA [Desulfuromonadaceae bacterium]
MRTIGKIPLLVITGPTAAGKTALALELAAHRDIEIISADSRQVYRHMDIGTAKASAQERAHVAHHCIDVVDVDEPFSVSAFSEMAHAAIEDIHHRGRLPVVVGGTGLYIRALTWGLAPLPGADETLRRKWHALENEKKGSLHTCLSQIDPEMAKGLHINDVTRIIRALEVHTLTGRTMSNWQDEHRFAERPYCALKLAVTCERTQLYQRIEERVELMLTQGLIEEARMLLQRGYSPELKVMRTIGYQQSVAYLRGELNLAQATEQIKRDTRRYAKRQLTWLRHDKEINWLECPLDSGSIDKWVDKLLCRCR